MGVAGSGVSGVISVGGIGVSVSVGGGIGVSVGGIGVFVFVGGGTFVLVGGTGVFVGGIFVGVKEGRARRVNVGVMVTKRRGVAVSDGAEVGTSVSVGTRV